MTHLGEDPIAKDLIKVLQHYDESCVSDPWKMGLVTLGEVEGVRSLGSILWECLEPLAFEQQR